MVSTNLVGKLAKMSCNLIFPASWVIFRKIKSLCDFAFANFQNCSDAFIVTVVVDFPLVNFVISYVII